jgi:hypothetical protein
MPFYLGLDLGQATDPTVAVVLEAHGDGQVRVYDIKHIEPYRLGTTYPAIIQAVSALLDRSPLQGQCALVIDHTGVGRAIYDMFVEAGLKPIGITITPGKNWHQESSTQYHVAKELLVGVAQKFVQSERIRGSFRVKHSAVLKRELKAFRVKRTKGLNEVYGPDVRESAHDDMVLACTCALWYAEHQGPPAASLAPAEVDQIWAEARERGELPPEAPTYRRLWDGGRRYW